MCFTRSSINRSKPAGGEGRDFSSQSDIQVPINGSSSSSPVRNFRVLGHVAMAVKKFKASLNPTITFRKRNHPEDELRAPIMHTTSGDRARSGRSPTGTFGRTYTRTPSGRIVERSTYETRGHITAYLFSPIPEVKTRS